MSIEVAKGCMAIGRFWQALLRASIAIQRQDSVAVIDSDTLATVTGPMHASCALLKHREEALAHQCRHNAQDVK